MRIERIITNGLSKMDRDTNGQFSLSFKSLQAQLATLLEDAGGNRVSHLLDALCQLNKCEQDIVLEIFAKLVNKIAHGEIRVKEDGGALREFEDKLYADLLKGLQEQEQSSKIKLEVLDGGKGKDESDEDTASVVDIKELRDARRTGSKPIIN